MTTNEDTVIRINARLMDVERRGQMARLVFAAPVGLEIDQLAAALGNHLLLGVLLEDPAPDSPN